MGGPPPKSKPAWPLILVAIGCLACCCPIGAAILFPVFAQARRAAKARVALSNAKQVDLAVLMFALDHHDKFPNLADSAELSNALAPYSHLPALDQLVASYEWNQELSKKPEIDVKNPRTTWLLYSKGPDARMTYEVGFADGHAVRVSPDELARITETTSKPASE
jgi:hypothetical protein